MILAELLKYLAHREIVIQASDNFRARIASLETAINITYEGRRIVEMPVKTITVDVYDTLLLIELGE